MHSSSSGEHLSFNFFYFLNIAFVREISPVVTSYSQAYLGLPRESVLSYSRLTSYLRRCYT